MATQDYAASIQGVSIRVTRLDANGNLLNGAGDSYTTSAFMRVSFTPEYEAGDEITEKSANGAICVTYKSPDTLKRITMELAICEPDAELTNLISGGLLLRKNAGTFVAPDHKSIGWAAPAVGDDPAGNGVSIEAWSWAIKDGKKAATMPYFYWVFPYAKLRQSGDRVIENGMLATTFEGYGLGNVNFGSAIDSRWEFPTAAERPYSYARSSWAPTGLTGFYTWHQPLSSVVTTKARTSNVSTLTTGTSHSFAIGDSVTIAGAPVVTSISTIAAGAPSAGSVTYTTSAAHGYKTGETVTVSNVATAVTAVVPSSPASGKAAYTVASTHTIKVGDSVTITGFSPTGYNGTFTVTDVTGTTFAVVNATTGAGTASSALAVNSSTANFAGTFVITSTGSTTTFAVTNVTTGVATSATGSANSLSTFSGVHTILSVPSATTFTYANTGSDYTSVTISPNGTAVVEAGSRAVTQLPDELLAGTSTFNVPGNRNYNYDEAIDFVINSNENPSV